METYSKALNAGQYPLSVLALTAPTAELYRKGVYGNTMTTNPRALDDTARSKHCARVLIPAVCSEARVPRAYNAEKTA